MLFYVQCDCHASLDLRLHDAKRRFAHVVGRIHCRVSGCDEWHQMPPVSSVQLRVPNLVVAALVRERTTRLPPRDEVSCHLEPQRVVVMDLVQQDRVWPGPLMIDAKESRDQRAWSRVRVELANPRHENCPINASKVAQDVGIDSSHLFLDRSE